MTKEIYVVAVLVKDRKNDKKIGKERKFILYTKKSDKKNQAFFRKKYLERGEIAKKLKK